MASSNEHAGHRERLRKKFINYGLELLEPHEALELYLFYSVNRKNTNPDAHRLIEEFGSLSAVFDASYEALRSRGKLSEQTAVLIKLLPEMARLYLDDYSQNPRKIMTVDRLPKYIQHKFIGLQQKENCFLLLMDSKGKELFSGMIAEGSFSESVIPTRTIVDKVMHYSASVVVLAHNHPSGVAIPSRNDLKVTQNISQLLNSLDVQLFDHYIVADDDCISMHEELGDIIFGPEL